MGLALVRCQRRKCVRQSSAEGNLRSLYGRRNAEEARRDLAACLLHWQENYPRTKGNILRWLL